MEDPKTELAIIKQVIKCNCEVKYNKICDEDNNDRHEIVISPSRHIEITVVDDWVIGGPSVVIMIDNTIKVIDTLKIVICGGQFYENNKIIGDEFDEDGGFDKPIFTFITNKRIGELTVEYVMETDNMYSYYGNQDGFNPSDFYISYDTEKYKNIRFKGCSGVSSEKKVCVYDDKVYDLMVTNIKY